MVKVTPDPKRPETTDFTVPGYVEILDLHGDVCDPQLVIFFAGNQFMVTDELIAAFKEAHPRVQRIYWQTLPPGVQVEQVKRGALTVGALRVEVQADVFVAGETALKSVAQAGWAFDRVESLVRNRLAILARAGDGRVRNLDDLAREDVRVALPDERWEGIGRLVREALRKAGGAELERTVVHRKVADGTAHLTRIHHRETPRRIKEDLSDAGPVWWTEAAFHRDQGLPVEIVAIPEEYNVWGSMSAGRFANAGHPEAAGAFLDFLLGPARSIYERYGFVPAQR